MEPKRGAGDGQWGHLLHPVLGLKIELRKHSTSGWVKYLLLLLFITGSAEARSGITPHPAVYRTFP